MNFAISLSVLFVLCLAVVDQTYADALEDLLRKRAIEGGLTPAERLFENRDQALSHLGRTFFESKALSLNGNISCRTCHLDRFGSADGIPVAAAIGGKGDGRERLEGGAKLLPRNTLPLWGRGGRGFNVFFWDGKVDGSSGTIKSQFGREHPSDDVLAVAVQLPVAEIREMLNEDSKVMPLMGESVNGAKELYGLVLGKLRREEGKAVEQLAAQLSKQSSELKFLDVARAISAFIRSEFRIRQTKLERFVFSDGKLSRAEIQGGLVFYGKGRCITCHSGPYFSDLRFHAIPFPQLGFGKNGFGVDYGRYNVTFDTKDLFRFRTPPLFNVEKTAPYGHSGSLMTLEEAIVAHFDPLRFLNLSKLDARDRHFMFKRLTASDSSAVGYLAGHEVEELALFLKALSF